MSSIIGKKSCRDGDGNYYKQVKIGTQTWMAENLKTTKYSDGTSIPIVTDTSWSGLTTHACCYPGAHYTMLSDPTLVNSSSGSNVNDLTLGHTGFGMLYNGYAVSEANGLAPIGWHVPSKTEYVELEEYLEDNGYGYGGSGTDFAKSLANNSGWVESGTSGHIGNDQASNNSTGLTLVPSGYRDYANNAFYGLGDSLAGSDAGRSSVVLWTGTIYPYAGRLYGWNTKYAYDQNTVSERGIIHRKSGYAVRCIKDS
tara:strand:- start:216 stop:980 length:765 start_codon:yes stop_codon:yes gene_type:complete